MVGTADYSRAHVAPSRDEPRRSCSFDKPRAVEGGIINGKAISKPAPAYPHAAKAAGVEGTVAVRVVVDEGGKVSSAEVLSGPELLREAATEAALRASFSPTRLSGQPVKVSGTITYNFVLD
ncbi:MAG TPA: energy transducer TonB [Pyrinomonadaceae bacterium]